MAEKDPADERGPYDFREQGYKDHTTVWDYVQITAVLATLPLAIAWYVVKTRLRSGHGHRRMRIHEAAWEALMEHVASNCTWTQLHILTPIRPLRLELSKRPYTRERSKVPGFNHYFGGADYSARWLVELPDRTPSDPVLLYLHGGSYAIKTQAPQIFYMVKLAKNLRMFRVNVLCLDYTISPVEKHPGQIREALACYEELSKTCKNIVLFGDSAGGHLALAMILKGAKVSGAMLISPSVDLTGSQPGVKDMREVYVPSGVDSSDPLISPAKADVAIWPRILPRYTAVVWGGDEEERGVIMDWAKAAGIPHFEEPEGPHDCILRGNENEGSQYIESQLRLWLPDLKPVEPVKSWHSGGH